MLDFAWRRNVARYDNPDAWLPDSVGHYFSAVVTELLCRQVRMRTFRICGRTLDSGPGGANCLLDFLFSRHQGIVRDVQRAFRYFGFDYALQRFDRIGYFLLVSGISELFDFYPSGHCFAQTRIGWVSVVLHIFKMFVRGVMILCIRIQAR